MQKFIIYNTLKLILTIWAASMTTATPAGSTAFCTALAISLVNRS